MKREATSWSDSTPEEEELLRYLLEIEAEQKTRERAPSLARRPVGADAPLSFGQQRLWLLDQFEGTNPSLHLSLPLGIEGPLNLEALRAALDAVVGRHEALRTRLEMVDGVPVQRVAPSLSLDLPVIDLSAQTPEDRATALAGALRDMVRMPFDLATGPLIRVQLVTLGPRKHSLLLVVHHVVTDRRSMLILGGEIAMLYGSFVAGHAPPLPELPVQYGDYALWERERLQGARAEELLAYWRRQLAGVEPLELPHDRPRPAQQTFDGAYESAVLPAATIRAFDQVARASGATRFMSLLAVLATVLARYSGQSDVTVGTAISNRSTPELERLIGLFINILVLRVDCSEDPSFNELLKRVRETTLAAYGHQDLPFERIVQDLNPARALNRTPLFQVLLVQLDQALSSAGQLRVEGQRTPEASDLMAVTDDSLSLEKLKKAGDETVQYDLEVYVRETPEGLRVNFVYNVDLFRAQTVRRMLDYFCDLLTRAAQFPDGRLSELPLLGEEESARVLASGCGPQAKMPEVCMHRVFEQQVQRTPEAIAIEAGDGSLTYRELNRWSNRLAHGLRDLGVGPGVLVGVCVDRSVRLLVSILGVMKSGGAYVPLDAEFPRERLAYMVEDAGLDVVVTRGALAAEVLPQTEATLVDVDAQRPALDSSDDDDLDDGAALDDLAYVIYTSGSTGRPKGVCIEHRSLANFALATAKVLEMGARDRLLGVASLSFDASVLDLFVPLVCGARTMLVARAVSSDGRLLAQLIEQSDASMMHATPATWQLLRMSGWQGRAGLRALSGGEALPWPLAEWLAKACDSVVNLYGPTETTVYVATDEVTASGGEGVVGIGRPLPNTSVCVLDHALRPVPPGVVGEVCIGGVQVARGYLNRADLTARQFVLNPHGGAGGSRLYRSGDLARYGPEGEIEFLGRADHQVKMRGYRIELGEIEGVLAEDAAVAQAVVLCREDVAGDQRLVGYVVERGDRALDMDALRAHLRANLPAYMVPSALVVLDALPLTPNRKVDRAALPAPRDVSSAASAPATEGTEMERLLAQVWRDALGVAQVSTYDNFFDLGGHSLLVVTVIERMRERTGISLAPREYMMQNLRQIAGLYEREHVVGGTAGASGQVSGLHLGGANSANVGGKT